MLHTGCVKDQTLGRALRRKKAENGYTYRQLDPILGATANAINRWHEDRSRPTAEHAEALMAYLGVDIDELGALILRGEMLRAGLLRP